jgi:hypothetical protein
MIQIKISNSHRKKKMRGAWGKEIMVFFVIISLMSSIFVSHATTQADYQHLFTFQSPELQTAGNFGTAVAIDGDIIVIGEQNGDPNGIINAGKAYIFNTTGHLLANLIAPDPQMAANFGWSVAVSGDRVVVGELLADIDGEQNAGRAHIFSTAGVHIKTLNATTPTQGVEFGMSVAVDENIILIGTYVRVGGSPYPDLRPSPPGTESLVYIYDLEGNFQETLESPGSTNQSAFGVSLAIDGDIIVIGEDHATVSGVDDAGRAYIFSTNGTPIATLEPSTPTNWGVFGATVAVHGDIVVVSEPASSPGIIHIYDTVGNKIKTLSGNYGTGIAVGSKIIVAGVEDPVEGIPRAGKACVYDLNGNLLNNLTSPNPQLGADFAAAGIIVSRAMAIDEGTLIVGVPLEDVSGNADAGRVYTFSVPYSLTTTTTEMTTTTTPETSPFWTPLIGFLSIIALVIFQKRKNHY